MTGEVKKWPVKRHFWPVIVRWPAVILSPDDGSNNVVQVYSFFKPSTVCSKQSLSTTMFKLASLTMFKQASSTILKPVNRQKQAVRFDVSISTSSFLPNNPWNLGSVQLKPKIRTGTVESVSCKSTITLAYKRSSCIGTGGLRRTRNSSTFIDV